MVQTLPAPAPLRPGVLRIIPLGGIGEIGRNMTVFELDGKILIVDCGVLFPEEHQPGIDVILPDFGYLKDRMDDVIGIFLTHGHEDHIGGVPYLLRMKQDIPILGSALTLAFVEAKLKEHKITPYSMVVREGQHEKLADFNLEFVAVNHSIPDALARGSTPGLLWQAPWRVRSDPPRPLCVPSCRGRGPRRGRGPGPGDVDSAAAAAIGTRGGDDDRDALGGDLGRCWGGDRGAALTSGCDTGLVAAA